jgi:hypothetical protein
MLKLMPMSLIHPAISLSGWIYGQSCAQRCIALCYPYQSHEGILIRLFALFLLAGRLLASSHAHSRIVIHTGHSVSVLL